MKIKLKRRDVTLIEMMIVMFLIAMIIGVVAYNYQGSLDEGKAFKTRAAIEKVHTIITLKLAENPESISDVDAHWEEYIKASPIVQNANALIKDGWGEKFHVQTIDVDGESKVIISSKKYNNYKQKHPTLFKDERID